MESQYLILFYSSALAPTPTCIVAALANFSLILIHYTVHCTTYLCKHLVFSSYMEYGFVNLQRIVEESIIAHVTRDQETVDVDLAMRVSKEGGGREEERERGGRGKWEEERVNSEEEKKGNYNGDREHIQHIQLNRLVQIG